MVIMRKTQTVFDRMVTVDKLSIRGLNNTKRKSLQVRKTVSK
jgi:hypothetical protein